MKEIWKDIKGYNNYKVSNLGNVKSLNYKRSGKAKLLRNGLAKAGYYTVAIRKSGKGKSHYIHRLVAVAFIPNTENKPCINHKNGIKTDNSIENLEWCTFGENNRHARETGLNISKKGKEAFNSIRIKQFTLDKKLVRIWSCANEVANTIGYHSSHIRSCCRGERKTHMGFIWNNY